MPLSLGSLAKALRLDKDDKRRARVKFVQGEGHKHDRLELDHERKKFNRKVKDITLRSKDDELIRARTAERQRSQELQKEMKKAEKNIESVIRFQKNREWRKRREEEGLAAATMSDRTSSRISSQSSTEDLKKLPLEDPLPSSSNVSRSDLAKLELLKTQLSQSQAMSRQNSRKN